MIILNAGVILFYLSVITGFIPFEYVWEGKLKSKEEMILFESISQLITFFYWVGSSGKIKNCDSYPFIKSCQYHSLWISRIVFS